MMRERDLALTNVHSGCSKALRQGVGTGSEHGALGKEKMSLLCCLPSPFNNEVGVPCAKLPEQGLMQSNTRRQVL